MNFRDELHCVLRTVQLSSKHCICDFQGEYLIVSVELDLIVPNVGVEEQAAVQLEMIIITACLI